MNDIYTWHNDLYPLVKKRFDLRYAKRLNLINKVAETVCRDDVDYRLEGVGGYGELPLYDGTSVASADSKRGFITTITPKEHALRVTLSYKKAKLDYSGEAAKVGAKLADSAYMTVLNEFYRLFGNAFVTVGADGVPWASTSHPVSKDSSSGTFSNLITSALSVSAITDAQNKAARFVTPDGLPFACNFDLLLVSPELEAKAREICGADAKLSPVNNPDADAPLNAANPVYGLKYMVVGGGNVGFSGKQWAIADSLMLKEVLKLVYITKPTVLVSPQDNPLITDYIGYVDFAFGFGDARPIIFSNPS
ncbi:MAG: hypothetical protein K6D98_05240 [Clostridiales bacterium]|nr:hypothetical protein [Clostridia bacterium]MCR5353693.1 hypothetical protein [Clostridiales bacterium]